MTDNESKKPIKILVVEDYATNREIIRSYLSGDRYLVSFAENGQQALEVMRNEAFDLILLDVQMPVMDGFEAARQIRKWEGASSLPHIPIIAMTAQVQKEEEAKFREAGMDDYIGKPFRRKELWAMVEKWVRSV